MVAKAIKLAILAASIGLTGASFAEKIEGKVVGISDGDTLTVLAGRRETRVRLAWIDAPETGHGRDRPGQPFGQAAKRSLSDLCFGRRASVEIVDHDRYGRVVGRVLCDGHDANLEQVRRGMAWAYVRYAPPREIVLAESEARASRRGLWSDGNATPPWEWRHKSGLFRSY
ncbi:MAG: hypothetical protein DI596_11640 [Azospira oryzae]|nr:MAG: hypothetical protein DI596_11640 [Azospira oryzae]PZP77835.1 MAG: hypothetical protein DI593_11640 [Azospira oryzae]